MGKISKRLVTGILCVALIIGFLPTINASVNAADAKTKITKEFLETHHGEIPSGNYIFAEDVEGGNYVIAFTEGNSTLDLNGKTVDVDISVYSNEESNAKLTINGSGTVKGDIVSSSSLTINGGTYTLIYSEKGDLTINNATVKSDGYSRLSDLDARASIPAILCNNSTLTINNGSFTGGIAALYITGNSKVSLAGGTFTAKGESSVASLNKTADFVSGIVIVDNESNASDSETKFKSMLASGCEYSPSSIKFLSSYGYLYTDQATIIVKNNKVNPENKAETPEDNSSNNNNNKKNYKNEWVDHQWYDANGNASYKYKGYWKCNDKGWWFEDENGWYPQDQWQKIDGKWYFFDTIGYMAQNEYAGSWSSYSEGNWWVGDDGAWDGSEPGVWRLSTNGKWWFKDSTGWFAQSKWYKIRGTWYYFDDEGWWDESKTE